MPNLLVEKFNTMPVSAVKKDLTAILG